MHGRTVLTAIDDALARFSEEYRDEVRAALADNGVEDPSPDEWYPQQAWLNTIEAIAADLEPHILDRLGEQEHHAPRLNTSTAGPGPGGRLETRRAAARVRQPELRRLIANVYRASDTPRTHR